VNRGIIAGLRGSRGIFQYRCWIGKKRRMNRCGARIAEYLAEFRDPYQFLQRLY
jgi:hypothetical protein